MTDKPRFWTPARTWRVAHVLYGYAAFLALLALEAYVLGSPEAFGDLLPGVIPGVSAGVGGALVNDSDLPLPWAIALTMTGSAALAGYVAFRADARLLEGAIAMVVVPVLLVALAFLGGNIFRRMRSGPST